MPQAQIPAPSHRSELIRFLADSNWQPSLETLPLTHSPPNTRLRPLTRPRPDSIAHSPSAIAARASTGPRRAPFAQLVLCVSGSHAKARDSRCSSTQSATPSPHNTSELAKQVAHRPRSVVAD